MLKIYIIQIIINNLYMPALHYQLLVLLVISICGSCLVLNRQSQILASALDIKFSPNSDFYLAFNKTHVALYNSRTGKTIRLISCLSQPTSISFNKNSTIFAYSQVDGNTTLYYIYKTVQQAQQIYQARKFKKINYQMLTLSQSKLQKLIQKKQQDLSYVIYSCFLADGQSALVVDSDGLMYAWTLEEGLIAVGDFEGYPTALSCSPSNPLEFSLAAKINETSTMHIYQIDYAELIILPKNITLDTTSFTRINYISYNILGTEIYVVGDYLAVLAYTAPLYEARQFYSHQALQYFKISLAKNGQQFAVVKELQVIYVKIIQNIQNELIQVFNQTSYQTNINTFGLSQNGTRFLYSNSKESAKILDQCPEGQYLNQAAGLCLACDPSCSICGSSSQICFQCANNYYLYLQQCLSCSQNCQKCIDSNSCMTCALGYQLKDNICLRGFQFWIFAVILSAAIVTFGCISFVTIITSKAKQRKRQKKQLISDMDAQSRFQNK